MVANDRFDELCAAFNPECGMSAEAFCVSSEKQCALNEPTTER